MEAQFASDRLKALRSTIAESIKRKGSFLLYGDQLLSCFAGEATNPADLVGRLTTFAEQNGWSVTLRDGGLVALFRSP